MHGPTERETPSSGRRLSAALEVEAEGAMPSARDERTGKKIDFPRRSRGSTFFPSPRLRFKPRSKPR